MSTTSLLKATGLHTNNNYFSVPEGSLIEATNIVINREGIVEPRRGIAQYKTFGTGGDRAKQLLQYKNKILVNYDSKIAYDDTSTFTDFSGTFGDAETNLRMKYIELNGNLYMTTSKGIRKIAAATSDLSIANITDSGMIKALSGTGFADYSQPGFLEGFSKVAYVVVWGIKDVNNNLLLGVPSSPIEVVNQLSTSCVTQVTFQVPQGINTTHFYRLYRTDVFTAANFSALADVTVNAEYKLVYEDVYTSGSSITIQDIVPVDYRNNAVNLYTNAISGEGILQANTAPPFAKDIANYKNHAFFANTRTKHQLLIDLIGSDGFKRYNALGDSITISSITTDTVTTDITFSAPIDSTIGKQIVILGSGSATLDGTRTITNIAGNVVTVTADGTGAVAASTSVYSSYVELVNRYFFVGRPEVTEITTLPGTTLGGTYFLLNSVDDINLYYVWYNTGASTDPTISGRQGIEVAILVTDTADDVADKTKIALDSATYDFVSIVTTNIITLSNGNNGQSGDIGVGTTGFTVNKLQDGQGQNIPNRYVLLSGLASPSQRIDDTARSLCNVINSTATETVTSYYTSGPTDTPGKMYLEAEELDSAAFTIIANSSETGGMFNPDLSIEQTSTNEEKPNRIYYSKTNQPESVPIVNYFDVGPRDKKILRILALRDSLFIMKEEGIYRLTGENPTNFQWTAFDNSSNLVAPDTAVILNNTIYAFTQQGIASISETGVSIISTQIENIIRSVTSPKFTSFSYAAFGIPYEADYSYLVWLPKLSTDTVATIAYRYNTNTQTWTTFEKEGNALSGTVAQDSRVMYIGASDTNLVEKERKQLTRDDYADRQIDLSLGINSVSGLDIILSSIQDVSVGDVIRQVQYLTGDQIEKISRKLVLDPGMPNTVGNSNKDFYRNFMVVAGDSLQTKLQGLVTQINSDLGTAFSIVFSADFATLQTEFNSLVTNLNLNATLLHTNYPSSSGTIEFEVFIEAIDRSNISVGVTVMQPLVVGPMTQYKSIKVQAVYNPMFFGEPSMLKHVREGVVMFENSTVTQATIGYNTDLSANFEDIAFTMDGDGSWGAASFGGFIWGGEGNSRPFRTLIPRQKQRCRFIRARYKHRAAFDKFSILGIAYTFEGTSERSYR